MMGEELEAILRAQYDGEYDAAREARKLLAAAERLAAEPAERQRIRNIVEVVDAEIATQTRQRARVSNTRRAFSATQLARVLAFVIQRRKTGQVWVTRRDALSMPASASPEPNSAEARPIKDFISSAIAAEAEYAQHVVSSAMSAASPRAEAITQPSSPARGRTSARRLPLWHPTSSKRATNAAQILASLGGADMDTLARVPQERTRFAQIAIVLLATAGLSAAAMIYALHESLGMPSLASIPLGLVFGIVIFSIDRLIIPENSVRHLMRKLVVIIPRMGLAVLVALLVSTPLVLHTFAADINTQLRTMEQEDSARAAELRTVSDSQQEQLAAAQTQVSTLEKQAQAERQKVLSALQAWNCELYGTVTGCQDASGLPGNGPLAHQKQQIYSAAVSGYNSIESQLNAADAALRAAEASSSQAQAQLASEVQVNQVRLDTGSGILNQLNALSKISAQYPAVDTERWTFLILFALIGFLPVAVGFALTRRSPSAYDAITKLGEEGLIASARAEREQMIHATEQRLRLRAQIEDDMRRRELDLGKHANERIAADMTNIVDTALREWANQLWAKLAASETGKTSTASPSPPGEDVDP